MMGLNWVKHWDSTENIIQYEQGLWYCGSQHAALWPHLEPLVMIFTRQHTFLRSWAHYTAYFILFKVHFSPQPAHFIYLWLFRRLGFHLLNPVMANGPMSNVISKKCLQLRQWCGGAMVPSASVQVQQPTYPWLGTTFTGTGWPLSLPNIFWHINPVQIISPTRCQERLTDTNTN